MTTTSPGFQIHFTEADLRAGAVFKVGPAAFRVGVPLLKR
jgi:hypothetical protein